MAGVGFALRRLAAGNSLLSKGQACAHGVLLLAGPWLLTILALAIVAAAAADAPEMARVVEFRSILTYNFALSMILTAPICMLGTRVLADALYREDTRGVGSVLYQLLFVSMGLQTLCSLILYCFILKMPVPLLLAAIISGNLLAATWVVMLFLSAVRRFGMITLSFAIGMFIAAVAACALLPFASSGALPLLAFSGGLAILLGMLLAVVQTEYPSRHATAGTQWKSHFLLMMGAFFGQLALWADKVILWFAADASVLPNGLRIHSVYDTAMFLAFLTVIPGMVFFAIQLETQFFEQLRKYFAVLRQKGNWAQLETARQNLLPVLLRGLRNLMVVQGGISVLAVLLAPYLFSLPRFDFMQLGVFRIAVLAAFFQSMTLYLLTFLTYVDDRRGYVLVQGLFLTANIIATLGFLQLGFSGYGYGFFIASVIAFVAALLRLARQLQFLTYRLLFERG